MQLGKLRTAIRAHKGTVLVKATLGGYIVEIPAQKAGLLKDVLLAFADSVNDETGLTFEDGVLWASGLSEAQVATAPLEMNNDDGAAEDLLLGEDEPEFEDLLG